MHKKNFLASLLQYFRKKLGITVSVILSIKTNRFLLFRSIFVHHMTLSCHGLLRSMSTLSMATPEGIFLSTTGNKVGSLKEWKNVKVD